MNTTLKEKISIMQAFEDGKEIETEFSTGWLPAYEPCWNWNEHNYRVKPEPRVVYINVGDEIDYITAYSDIDKARRNCSNNCKVVQFIEAVE